MCSVLFFLHENIRLKKTEPSQTCKNATQDYKKIRYGGREEGG